MGTVTFDATKLTLLDDGESLTGWSGVGDTMPDLETDFFQQGSSCVANNAASTGLRGVIHDWVDAGDQHAGVVDFTVVGRHLFCWVWGVSKKVINTRANGGMRIRVSSDTDAGTDYNEYFIGGNDVEWSGSGWHLAVIDVANAIPDNTDGSLDKQNVRAVGFLQNLTATVGRSNGQAMDIIRYGEGVQVTGGTTSDPITIENIIDEDEGGGGDTYYGVLTPTRDDTNSILLNGRIVIGDEAGSTNTVFVDSGKNIIAQDNPVAFDFTGWTVMADTGATTDFTLGDVVGTGSSAIGSSGLNFSNNTAIYDKTAFFTLEGSATIDLVKMYGCNWSGWNVISLGENANAVGGSGDIFDLVDCEFLGADRIIKNIGATVLNILHNNITFNNDFKACIDIEDQTDVSSTEFNIIQSSGFIETTANGSPITFAINNFNFDQFLLPYINITDADETWDVLNPTWTVEKTGAKAVEFVISPATNDEGQISADAQNNTIGSQRQLVRDKDGVLYIVRRSLSSGFDVEKSIDDGATWSGNLDNGNRPVGTAGVTNPTVAIDSAGLIGMIWWDSTVSDVMKFTTFNTADDRWNAGSPASEIIIKSNVTSESPFHGLACDSNDEFHAVYWDETGAGDIVYYNNSIDWGNNEVTIISMDEDINSRVDIAIRPSDDIPIISVCGLVTASNPDVRFYEGNVNDATSFSELIVVDGGTGVISGGSMVCCDNDTTLICYRDEDTDENVIMRLENGLQTDTPEEVFRVADGGTEITSPTITARNNRVVMVIEDTSDDEISFYESRNYGVIWSGITAITSGTTSSEPLVRACHGLHEGQTWKLDIAYRVGSVEPHYCSVIYNPAIDGDVRELFQITGLAQEPSGALISDARIKIVEENEKDFEEVDDLNNDDQTVTLSTSAEIIGSEFTFTNPTSITKMQVNLSNSNATAGTIRAVVITGATNGQNDGTIIYASPTRDWVDISDETGGIRQVYEFVFTSPVPLTGDILVALESSGISGTGVLGRNTFTEITDQWLKDDISTGNWSQSTTQGITMRVVAIEKDFVDELADEISTGGSGESVTTDYLRRVWKPSIEDTLFEQRHEDTAFKSYKYGKLPFVTTLGNISAKLTQVATQLPDVFQVEGTPATAITLGDVTQDVQIEKQTNPAIIIKWSAGTGTLSVGDIIDNDINGGQATLVEILEGDSVAGTGLFDNANDIPFPTELTVLTDTPSAGDWLGGSDNGLEAEYTWLIDADTLTLQQLYDYFNAKFNVATLDTASDKLMDDICIWGRAEHGLPIQGNTLGSPNTFDTVRNVTSTEGWAIYNFTGGIGTVASFTGNGGNTFVPSATVTVQVTVVEAEDFVTAVVGARVGIHRQSDNSEIMNDTTNGSGVVSTSFTYTGDVPVFIRVRQETEAYVKIPATITATGLITTISVADDDIYA